MSEGRGRKRFVIEPHSPYCYILLRARVLIMAVIFDVKKFHLLEIAIRAVLKAKNKLGFIKGTLTRPTETNDVNSPRPMHGRW